MKKNKREKSIKSGKMLVYNRIKLDLMLGTVISTIEKITNYFLDKIVKLNYNYYGSELKAIRNTNLIIMEA